MIKILRTFTVMNLWLIFKKCNHMEYGFDYICLANKPFNNLTCFSSQWCFWMWRHWHNDISILLASVQCIQYNTVEEICTLFRNYSILTVILKIFPLWQSNFGNFNVDSNFRCTGCMMINHCYMFVSKWRCIL